MDAKLQDLTDKVLQGEEINRQEAEWLTQIDIEELAQGADRIRQERQQDEFDMCSVISIKGGRCSEDCKFSSQASCSKATVKSYPLRGTEEILKDAKKRSAQGIRHYCLVASGHHLSEREVDALCETVRVIRKDTALRPCVSGGLMNKDQFMRLKEAGVVRIHNNLETSRTHFAKVCGSHTYDDKIATLKAAKEAGLSLCSGGLFGIGESMADRLDLAFTLREIAPDTVPINLLDPVEGTPMGHNKVLTEEEVRRIIGVFKYILPNQMIRLAAGRDYLEDTGLRCFRSGCNAAITGDLLTVMGTSVEGDLDAVRALGYRL